MEEKDREDGVGQKAKDLAGQLADKAATSAKDAAGHLADKATDAAKDAARGVSLGATKAALGVVDKMQDQLEKKVKEGEKASSAQKKDGAKKAGAKKTSSRKKKPQTQKKSPVVKVAIVAVVVVVAVVAVAGALWGPGRANFMNAEDFVTSTQLEEAIDIDELSTAEFVYNGIAEKYKADSDEIEYRISYDAKVKAGIKMSEVTFDVDNESKIVRPQLPDVTITNIEVDTSQLGYMPENPNGDLHEILDICEQDIASEAGAAEDFRTTAEENLKSVIEALTTPILKGKGYTLEWPENN